MTMEATKQKRTVSEAWLRKQIGAGKKIGEVAQQIGFHYSAVSAALQVLGIKSIPKDRGQVQAKRARAYLALLEQDFTVPEIAKMFSKHQSGVYADLARAGLPTSWKKAKAAKFARESVAVA